MTVKNLLKTAFAILMVNYFCFSAYAEEEKGSASSQITARAKIKSIASFSATPMDIETNEEREHIYWDNPIMGTNWRPADAYILIDIECNHNWRLDIYTDNSQADTGYQKAGLISSDNSQRLPLGWLVSNSTAVFINEGEPGELVTSKIDTTEGPKNAPWIYLKDKNDINNPSTSWDESWENAFEEGYTTVMYGGPGLTSLAYQDMDAESPVAVFLEASFSDAVGDISYSTTIYFDLVSE